MINYCMNEEEEEEEGDELDIAEGDNRIILPIATVL